MLYSLDNGVELLVLSMKNPPLIRDNLGNAFLFFGWLVPDSGFKSYDVQLTKQSLTLTSEEKIAGFRLSQLTL